MQILKMSHQSQEDQSCSKSMREMTNFKSLQRQIATQYLTSERLTSSNSVITTMFREEYIYSQARVMTDIKGGRRQKERTSLRISISTLTLALIYINLQIQQKK